MRRSGLLIAVVWVASTAPARADEQTLAPATDEQAAALRSAPSEGLPPEQVVDWLNNLPDEAAGPEEEEDEPPHRHR